MISQREEVALPKQSLGTVICFAHPSKWGKGTKSLVYVAYLAKDNQWYTTASELNSTVPEILSTQELLKLLHSNPNSSQLEKVSTWDSVVS